MTLILTAISGDGGESPPVPESVDHLIYATPDLERGMQEIQELLGVRPVAGGRHPDYGTRNALVSVGPRTYLEVLAPDPELPVPERGRLFDLDSLEKPRLRTWVLRAEEIEAVAVRARSEGLALGPVGAGSRENPDGEVLSWRLTDPYALLFDGAVPFLVAWGDAIRPASSTPRAGDLVGLKVLHPEPTAVQMALNILGVQMTVEPGDRMELVASILVGDRLIELR